MSKFKHSSNSAVILIHCPDQPGLIHAVTDYIFQRSGNILDLDEHVDRESGDFFMRVNWDLGKFKIPEEKIEEDFKREVASKKKMTFQLFFSRKTPRMAVMVSKESHCLFDILSRKQSGEWSVEIPVILGNHEELRPVCQSFGIDFCYVPVTANQKAAAEKKQLEILERHKIDFVVLARYMQILSRDFIARYPSRIINIHHSFLPAFPGSRPYHSAHERGVKIIGATSHYVTEELDQGPIIDQDVTHISHRDSVQDLVRKGRDLEKVVLARAIWYHLERKILVHGKRTIRFD